jgi:hypothetical protein
VQELLSLVHAVPLGFAGPTQFPELHVSGPVQGLPSSQAAPLDRTTFEGQPLLAPVQVSAGSHGPLDARQTAPAGLSGCWHDVLVPLQTSSVHALPSSAQGAPALPAGCRLQVSWEPSHKSKVQGLVS